MKKYIVRLEAEERERLEGLVGTGRAAAYKIRHANILLAVNESERGGGAKLTDEDAARAFGVSVRSIEYLRQRFVEEGLDAALDRKKQLQPSVCRMFDGEKEARLIAVACGPKPPGRKRWTLELLADRAVTLKIVEHCSPQTVMRLLKKTRSSPGKSRCGAFRPSVTPSSSVRWKTCWRSTDGGTIRSVRWSASTRRASNWWAKR
jgi:transposase